MDQNNIDEHEVKCSYQYVLDLRERLEDTLKLAQEQLKLSQAKQKCYYDKRTKVRRFQPGDKVLVLLPTDTNKLLLQWKGPYEVAKVVGPNDYKVLMKGKEKTLHANLLKKYVMRENSPIGNVVSHVQDDDRQNVPSCVAGVEDYEPDAGAQGADDPSAEVPSAEDLPEIGSWGPKESVTDLKFGDELSTEQVRELQSLTSQYSDIFSDCPGDSNLAEHHIDLTSDVPVRQTQYPVPYAMQASLKEELQQMEEMGIIRKSSSPYSSPVVVVKKKDGGNRICVDFRRLNKVTIIDPQPVPSPSDSFLDMRAEKYFSKLDLTKGYHQIRVRPADVHKTAFVTMGQHYEYLRMPFGMVNSGMTMTRAVRKLLDGMDNVVDYIDDLLVHTRTWEEHVQTLKELFKRLKVANFVARPTKCVFGATQVDFLGHCLGQDMIELQDVNVQKMRDVLSTKDLPKIGVG